MKKMIKDSWNIMGRYEPKSRDEMIELMDRKIEVLPEVSRASAKFELVEYHEDYDSNTYYGFFMTFERLETDKEEKAREKRQAEIVSAQQKREQAEWKRLNKIYGDKK